MPDVRLTALAVEKARPRDARYEMADGRGLYLVVQPSGAKGWACRYRRQDGTTAKLTIGAYPTLDLKEARRRATEAIGAVAAGRDPSREKKAARAVAKAAVRPEPADTVTAAIDGFMTRHAYVHNRVSVAREAERILRRELRPWLSARLETITPDDVQQIVDQKMDDGSPAAATRTLAVIRKFFGWCVTRRKIAVSPCAGMKPPAPASKRDRVLSEEELRVVYEVAGELGSPFGPIVRLLILTGQRRGEVSAVEVDEIDLSSALWSIPASRMKAKKPHTVPLSPQAMSLFEEAAARDRAGPFLFGVVRPPSGWSKAKRRLDQLIGDRITSPWTLHDIRRSVATGMAERGVAVPVVERLLAHTSGTFHGIVNTYQRQEYMPERKAALEMWSTVIAPQPQFAEKTEKSGFDKVAYQREYMRRRRAQSQP